MKILTLDLRAFGPFTGARLDLSAGEQGLHVILGANEAGKTSAMRALSSLLFGFPPQTSDVFLHGYDRLRVGATLRKSDGEVLEVVRRKGNKNTLREADDLTIVPDERLERHLGAIDRRTFDSLFGLDREKLAAAGEEIRHGKGLLGEALFAAGTGLAGLRKAQQEIRGRLDLLFKPRAQNPAINRALAELREAREVLKKSQLPGEDWIRLDGDLGRSRVRAAELVEALDRLRRDRDRLIRTRAAIPQAARRREVRVQIDGLGPVVRLRDGFGDACRSAQEEARAAAEAIERSRSDLGELERDLGATPEPGPVLAAEAEVDALVARLGAVEKAVADRVKRAAGAAEQEYKAREILRRIGRPPDLVEAEALRSLRDDEVAAIRALGQEESGLRAQHDAASRAIAEREALSARLAEERGALGEPADAGPLRRAVARARALGDLDDRLSRAAATLEKRAREVRKALSRVPGWSGTADDLAGLLPPLGPAVDRIEAAIRRDGDDLRGLDEKVASATAQLEELSALLDAQERSLDVPTERDLLDARARRDEAWRIVRSGASRGDADALAAGFERAMHEADLLSDRLRREAEHVARKADWLARCEAHRSAIARLEADRRDARTRLEAQGAEWRAMIAPLGVALGSPGELRAWLALRAEVLGLAEKAREAEGEHRDLARDRDELTAALGSALASLGRSAPGEEEGLAAPLDVAESTLKGIDRDADRRLDLDRRLAEARAEADRDRRNLLASEARLAEWRTAWAGKMNRLGYEPDVTPAQAESLLADIQALGETMIKYRGQSGQVRSIDRDVEQFAADVAAFVLRIAPDLDARPYAAQVREVARRLKEARELAQKRSDLTRRRDAESARLAESTARHAVAVGTLQRLCREAGCDAPEGLAPAAERSRSLTQLEAELRSCEEGLRASASGDDLDEFAAAVERARSEDLAPAIARIEVDIAAMDAELGEVKQAIGLAQGELRRMDGGDHSASASEAAQALLAGLRGDVDRFATFKLAEVVLRRGIDRYREKNQGPILTRAGALFADLTAGSFARLQIDDEDGRAILQGVRSDGTTVGVEGMSDGSHDQLYLALRLASLESWLRVHEPIPLVVDDILLHFDDRRAAAALRALAELSRRTQVLFFTHHRHLADLAESSLPGDVVFRHELADPSTMPS